MADRGGAPRVVLITEQRRAGGKRSHVESLAAGFRAIGWDSEVFDTGRLSLIERIGYAGPWYFLERVRPGLGQRWSVPHWSALLSRHLRRLRRPDGHEVWNIQEAWAYPGTRDAAEGRPIVLTVHGPAFREIASARGIPLDDPLIRWLRERESLAAREADALVSVDHAHAEYARELGRTGPIHVIPNFVDTRRFHPDVSPTLLDEATERWLAGRPILLCPRRLVPKNGVAVALRAAALLRERGRDVALLVAGEGPQHAEVERLSAELNLGALVRLLGNVVPDTMPGLCRRAAAVLVPSVPSGGIEEATSISALEGQATGRPVVASRLGGIREIVTHEETGLLFEPGDAAALASAVERVLDDPGQAAALGARAVAHVRERHSHEAGARAYAEVYATVGVAPLSAGR